MKRLLCSLALLMALGSAPAFGQGCAMCWSSANAAGERGKQALNNAVTMLLVPTLGFMAGFVVLTVRYSRQRENDEEDSND
jgi:heme/copper-type cytochrome/quinol oxidase subunit 2